MSEQNSTDSSDRVNSVDLVNNLNFATLNVNGLARKLKNDYFVANMIKYDFISLVETWCTKQSNLNLNGYEYYSEESCKTKKKG